MIEVGKKVKLHYEGTFEDGVKFDSSRDRGEALEFVVGSGQMISGFEAGVQGLSEGDTKNISLTPQEGYGERNEDAIQTYPMNAFPEGTELTSGAMITGHNELGQPLLAKVLSVTGDSAVLDFNHPLAGKNLNFSVEILSVE